MTQRLAAFLLVLIAAAAHPSVASVAAVVDSQPVTAASAAFASAPSACVLR
ncbi:hypothetical protein D3C87_2133010 [compost metagenome]